MRCEVVDQNSHEEEDEYAGEDGAEHVAVAEGDDLGGADVGDEGGGATGWVQGLGDLHEHDGGSHGQGGGQPQVAGDDVMDRHAHDGADQVPADEVARLRQGAVDNAIDQHGRCAEGADQEYVIDGGQVTRIDPSDQGYTQEGTDKGPYMIREIDQCFLIEHIAGDPELAFDLLFQVVTG